MARRIELSRHAGCAEDAFGRAAALQQIGWQGLADKVVLPLRPRKYDAVVVGYSVDPGRSEVRPPNKVGHVRCLERHDEHVEDGVALQHGDFHIEDRPAVDGPAKQVGNLPLFRFEHALRRLGIRSLGQRRAELRHCARQLLVRSVDQHDGRVRVLQRLLGLGVKSREVAAPKRQGRREGLQYRGGTIDLAVDVMGQVFRDLQNAALYLRLLEPGHPVEGVDGDTQQWRRQDEREQGEEDVDPLRRNSIFEDTRGHAAGSGFLSGPGDKDEWFGRSQLPGNGAPRAYHCGRPLSPK